MFLISIILLAGCTIIGIRFWRKNRIISLLSFIPLLVVMTFIGYSIYQSWYHTTPDSLQLSVHKENKAFVVNGSWKDHLDAYRFPSDFLVFYVPNNEEIPSVKRNRVKDYKNIDWKFLKKEVQDWAKTTSPSEWEPQIFDLQTDTHFQFSFTLPENIKPSDVKLYYVHAREEPMDALEFWFKDIDLK